MRVRFCSVGHPNIRGTHKTTFELTAERELSKKGTCIVGVNADFPSLARFLTKSKVVIILAAAGMVERVVAEPNPSYFQGQELVVRKGNFSSNRTFAIRADKSAADLDRAMIKLLKNPKQELIVEISDETEAT